MSSAAKLRRFGKGTAAVAVAATVMTAFGPAAFASWDEPSLVQVGQGAAPGPVAGATTGTIGVVDTNATTPDNQGATLVQAGKDGQAIGSVRFVIPNRFVSGDIVELRLLDRAATETTDGSANSGPDYKLGFSADPTVTVSAVQNSDTVVAGDTDAPATGTPAGTLTTNTETAPENPWVSTGVAPAVTTVKPTVAPSFSVARAQSKGVQGSDIIRLTHTGNPSSGDPSASWVVTLSGLQVDVGSKITPGALRIVPFAVNKAISGNSYSNSAWFYNNAQPNSYVGAADPSAVPDRQIGIYTVPAYVAPISFSAASADIISDGTPQGIGDLTISEIFPASITGAVAGTTYTVDVTGATIANSSGSTITVTLDNPETGQTVSTNATLVDNNTFTFTVTGGDNTKISSYKVGGLQLQASSPSQVRFRLSGGSVSSYLTPGGTGPAVGTAVGTIVPPETDISTTGVGINQDDIAVPSDATQTVGTASAGNTAIGGNNRYETARKIALQWGRSDYAIIASGENYPDALSSGFLSQRVGAPIVLTMRDSVPADTMESLRERGVRKVFIVGGEAAISKGVSDKLLATPSYMFSESAGNLVPRGGNLEVVRLGGDSRYSTNALVNMYAAAQNVNDTTVGRTTPMSTGRMRTTAMLARGDNFADALTANLLTAGVVTTGGTTTAGTLEVGSSNGNNPATATDLSRLGVGTFAFDSINDPAPAAAGDEVLPTVLGLYVKDTTQLSGWKLYAQQAAQDSAIFNVVGGNTTITFANAVTTGAPRADGTAPEDEFANPTTVSLSNQFTVTEVGGTSSSGTSTVPINALPVILTPKGELGSQAQKLVNDLHIEHVLVVGGADVISDATVKAIDGMNVTTRRLGGKDRYETAKAVNEYAITSATPSATNTTPGLGYTGGYTTVNSVTTGEHELYLANGLKFPDALVAGPWVSRKQDAMVLAWVDSIPDATKAFLTDNAEELDRAIGLGLGSAISSKVITEANRLVNAK